MKLDVCRAKSVAFGLRAPVKGGSRIPPPPIRSAIWLKFAHSLAFGMVITEIHVCRSKVVAFVLGAWYKGGGSYTPPIRIPIWTKFLPKIVPAMPFTKIIVPFIKVVAFTLQTRLKFVQGVRRSHLP